MAAAVLSISGGAPVWLDGLLFDGAVAVRAHVSTQPVQAAHVAVVAIDPESLNSAELSHIPRVFFGPIWGQLTTDLTQAGAKVVAFDLLLSYSANQFQKNYDRPFMAALYKNRSRVVLGRSARGVPARNYLAALRNDAGALGSMDINPDADEIFRSLPSATQTEDGDTLPSLVGAALKRAGSETIPKTIRLAPNAHPESAIPTYGLSSVLDCAKRDPAALKTAFNGRVVFVGSTLPEEDRKTTSSRFLAPQHITQPPISPCGLRALPASVPGASNVPGVHLHAVAAEAVLSNHLTKSPAAIWPAAVAGVAALAGAVAGFVLAPLWALAGVIAITLALWGAEIVLLAVGWWLPVGLAALGVVGSAIVAYVVRFVLEEGKRRRIQKAFGFYLAPTLVDQMVDDTQELRLGGEKRDVTIMFADLSGFTALSGIVGPEELVSRTNEYLTLIVEEVEATGGYVDKFIGDAVMAMWGAPVALDDHPISAVAAAIQISDKIAERHARAIAAGEHGFAIKVGVNSGDAVVGNVGSEKRFNYTAVGEAVNIAARLEGLPGTYDCSVILGPETAARVRGQYTLREIDMVTVKGKTEPISIFEPYKGNSLAAYGKALAAYRTRSFKAAAEMWDAIGDGPSQVMAERARTFLKNPPPDQWNGVWEITTK